MIEDPGTRPNPPSWIIRNGRGELWETGQNASKSGALGRAMTECRVHEVIDGLVFGADPVMLNTDPTLWSVQYGKYDDQLRIVLRHPTIEKIREAMTLYFCSDDHDWAHQTVDSLRSVFDEGARYRGDFGGCRYAAQFE